MLLKQCLIDLNISQSKLAAGIGWSRTQVNLFVNKGKFPVDAERFKAGIRLFAEQNPAMLSWLSDRQLTIEAYFDLGTGPVDLDAELMQVAQQTALYGPRSDTIQQLITVSRFLLDRLRRITERAEIETEGYRLLRGGV